LRHLLLTLARDLVQEPGRVRVSERLRDETAELELEVEERDRGSVIGRGGRTAAALRVLLEGAARRQGGRCRLEITD
jgi:predicted RNA-binding protein YlqC (UPF0109 family)